ncbi:Uncharacterised protein [Yersinia aleksiciae]|uniref:Uncharacterized protein n=1 Tax=Yersinia aleksiciae TaxID=263819 RepID=A0A0T9U1H5_YERAE|nr:Uncharacterised protein [Yersinia aleksiciae]
MSVGDLANKRPGKPGLLSSRSLTAKGYTLRKTKEPFVPPKPKELHRVYSISFT